MENRVFQAWCVELFSCISWGSLTAAGPLQLHLLHVDLTGCHPYGNWVDNGCVLQDRQKEGQEVKQIDLWKETVIYGPQHFVITVYFVRTCFRLLTDSVDQMQSQTNYDCFNHGLFHVNTSCRRPISSFTVIIS